MLEKISELCLSKNWGGMNLNHGVNQLIRCKRFIEDIEDAICNDWSYEFERHVKSVSMRIIRVDFR